MKQKSPVSRFDNPAFMILGLVFTILGSVFTTLGIIVGLAVEPAFFLAFGIMGVTFLGVGIGFLAAMAKKRRQKKFLLERGNYIMANIMETRTNFSVQVNGHYAYEVLCRYRDYNGTVHVFKSPMLWVDPAQLLTADRVRVYVDGDDYDHYYVDIESVLPQIQMH